ncbi:SGNH/GDSL hydrolase family protein [Streptomyces sp. NPDC047017]|uniref:SGNH/GDSL hydrolase family protein n=1 Tax=Streptomyces sp. NPDC047017 TaxID=3155024 RepID=UPI0033CA760B
MTLHHSPTPAPPTAPATGRRHAGAVRAALAAALATAAVTAPATPAGAQGRPAHPAAGEPVRYVALGDSYSSGLGIPEQTDLNCGRSSSDYPHLVAQSLGAASFTDVTCAGATTQDMTQRQGSAPAQLDALRPDTTLVTLGIGGNDLDLTGTITRCVILANLAPNAAPCKASYTVLGQDGIRRLINATAPRVEAVLKEIHRRSPQATVLLVGYPAIVPDDGSACRDLIPFATGDFPWFRDKEKELDSMLAEQADVYDATYVDLYGPSIGHDACEPDGVRWIEPRATDTAAGFHPNATGHQSAATAVRKALTP